MTGEQTVNFMGIVSFPLYLEVENIHIFGGLKCLFQTFQQNLKSMFCVGFRFLIKLKMWSSIMIITARSLNHQLDVMKNHISTWYPKSTERLDFPYYITFFVF